MSKPSVGVVGLGSMGGGVAKSLLRADFPVRVCDVRPAVVQSFVDSGAIGCATPAELGAACDVVIVLVVNAEQVDAVLFGENGAAPAMRSGSVLVMSVTVAPDYAVRLAARLAERGILMIDGPVSGGAAKAATGEMTVMGSGPPEAFAKCEGVLSAIAQKVYRLGDAPGTGSKVKMVNQLLAGVHIAAAAEAMALGIKAGADPACSTMSFPTAPAPPGCSRTACPTFSPATTRRIRPSISSSRISASCWRPGKPRASPCRSRPPRTRCS